MYIRNSKITVFTTLLVAITLGGCLSEEPSTGSGFVADDTSDTGGTSDTNDNRAPTIYGNPPPAAMVGQPYSFTPTASDPDGDAITFSIDNKPSWADFDDRTGELSGTPTMADIGWTTNISISVSDSQTSSTMTAFDVEVTNSALGSIELSWSAPTQNADGSTLTDLAGYKIYYGNESRDYTNEIIIDNASITNYLVDNLVPDTYFFAATAFNSSGFESSYSSEAVRTVN